MVGKFQEIFMEITVFKSIHYRVSKTIKKCVADSFRMATAQMVLISLCPQMLSVSTLIFLPRSIILSPTYVSEQTTCYVNSHHWYL